MLLTMLLTCCVTKPVESVRLEYIIPELTFPIFPALTDAEKNEDGTISVSKDWIVLLAEYKIRIEETEKTYNDLRELYKNKVTLTEGDLK